METTIIILISLIVGSVLGYYFCKLRYQVDKLLLMLKCYVAYTSGDLSAEEFLKKINEN